MVAALAGFRRVLGSFGRVELGGLAAFLAVYIGVHAALAIPSFGEDDAANFAMDAVGWHLSGAVRLDNTDYRMRTSPLYTRALAGAMDHGLPIRDLPRAMALASIVLSAVTLLSVYLLFRSLAGRLAAAISVVLLSVTPGMWLGASYGMATVPALCFWLLALRVCWWALDQERGRPFWAGIALATALSAIALSLKADLILTGLAFPGLAWVKRRLGFKTVVATSTIVVVGLAMQMLYVKSVVSTAPDQGFLTGGTQSLAGYTEQWHRRFPFELDDLVHGKNLDAATHSSGPFLFAVALFALACGLVGRKHARLAFVAALWGFPLVAFWVLIPGNSARHNLGAQPPLMLAVALLVTRVAETRARAIAITCAMVVLNYFSDMEGEHAGLGTMMPKTNLLQLSADLKQQSLSHVAAARPFTTIADPKKAAIDRHLLAWVIFEEAAVAETLGHVTAEGREFRVDRKVGGPQIVRFAYANDPAAARRVAQPLRTEGFSVWSSSFRP
jgi:hypothetical protein